MAVRFRKSVKLGKGVRLNVGKSSVGLSVGGKHGGMSFNSKTGTKARTSLPGTGVSYITSVGKGKKASKKGSSKRMKDFEEIAVEQSEKQSGGRKASKETQQKRPKRRGWLIVLCVLLVFGALDSCGDNEEAPAETPIPTENQAIPTETVKPSATPAPTEEVRSLLDETGSKSSEPVDRIVPSSDQSGAGSETAERVVPSSGQGGNQSSSGQDGGQQMVWIPQTGSKYHSNPNCSGMENPSQVTLDQAVSSGYTPCKRCH